MGDLRKSCIYGVSLLEWGQFQQRKRKKKTRGRKREGDNGRGWSQERGEVFQEINHRSEPPPWRERERK